MARPGSSYMQEAPPGYRWKTVTKINAMGRPYTTRILVPIDALEPTQPTQVPQPQTAAGIFEDSGYGEMVTDQFPGGYPGQATTPQPATPPDWRDSFVGRAPPMAKKKDITTVIKKSEDPGVATTETITIKGGLMGEDDIPTGQDDPQDERGMGMWNAEMAQLRARQQQGTAAPTQQAVEAALGRYGDVRRSQFTPPPQYPPQASGALPTPPQPDPRFQRMKPGQMMGMVDPSWSAAVPGSNVPPVAPPPQAPVPPPQVDVGQGDFPGRTAEFGERGMRDWNAQMAQLRNRQQTGGAAPTQAQIEESLGRYGDFRRGQLTPPTTPSYSDQELARMTPPPQADQRIEDLNKLTMPPRLPGQDLPREVTEGGRASFPMGEDQGLPTEVTEGGRGSFPEPTAKESKAADNAKMAANPNLEKVWGKFAYDPAARKKYFLDGMKDIYKKAMLLNLIAVMTGGESQAAAFIEAKTAELKMVDKFDEEERITNIWKEVFTDATGNPYMPKDKREAAERAGRTGARPSVIKDIFGAVPEAKAKQQYHRVDPKDPTKWEHKRFPAGEEPSDEWVSGKAGSKSPAEGDIASIEALKYLQKLENENSPYADEYANIINARRAGKQVATGTGVSFFNKMIEEGTYTLPEGENNFSILQKFLSLPEVTLMQETADGLVEVVVPGWSTITGQTPSKIEIAEATGGAEETTERVDARTRAQQLKAEGKTKEEAKRIMREEGYDIG